MYPIYKDNFTSESEVCTAVYLGFVCPGNDEVRGGNVLLPIWFRRGSTQPSGIPVTIAAGPSSLLLPAGVHGPRVCVTIRMSLPIAVSISLLPP